MSSAYLKEKKRFEKLQNEASEAAKNLAKLRRDEVLRIFAKSGLSKASPDRLELLLKAIDTIGVDDAINRLGKSNGSAGERKVDPAPKILSETAG